MHSINRLLFKSLRVFTLETVVIKSGRLFEQRRPVKTKCLQNLYRESEQPLLRERYIPDFVVS